MCIRDRDNLLSEVFGDCSGYVIYDINKKSVVNTKQEIPPLKSVAALLDWVKEWGITDLIVHRIDKSLVSFFSDTKINLFIGVPICLLYTSPSPRDRTRSRMPSSA